jgi:hypothetical protein
VLWPRPLLIGATVVATLTAGVVIGRQLQPPPARAASRPPAVVGAVAAHSDQRQLQFAMPGGTRVIWVFNPQFEP